MTNNLINFDIQGHRGCRGLFPENTIAGFIHAVDLGVTTLELDVVITSDKQVLVSHDPFMSHEICKTPEGESITISGEKAFNIYQMTVAQAQQFDCGLTINPNFPDQVKMPAVKPTLNEVIDVIENYTASKQLPAIRYNIETKCTPEGDNIFHPGPEEFSELLIRVITNKKIYSRTIIQSFDIRTLQYIKLQHTPVALSLLVENVRSVTYNLKKLGFLPDVYSPHYKLLTKRRVKSLHEKNIKVIPWTVNKQADMERLIAMGVDGIITDYPDLLKRVAGDITRLEFL